MTVNRRGVTAVLGFLASFTAFTSIGLYSTGTAAYREAGGATTLQGITTDPFGLWLATAVLASALLALVGTILFLRGRRAAPTLLAAGVLGLVAVVPGLLALLTYRRVALDSRV
ncbi:hypothetical protein [Catellatospora tritici]|uniref:hypothetical protein n=1 Tax=Catellatospora tritici TaxID=2851566 RepID=UPI001C2D3225|nr:hypothetical protein [Catellatospora tritici]MBV1848888.1 hypothetical protein [Catellatospora tritici]